MQRDEGMVLTGKPLNNKRVHSYYGELELSVEEGIVRVLQYAFGLKEGQQLVIRRRRCQQLLFVIVKSKMHPCQSRQGIESFYYCLNIHSFPYSPLNA